MSFANDLIYVGIGALVATNATYRITDKLLPYRTLDETGKPTPLGIATHAAVAIGLAGAYHSLERPQTLSTNVTALTQENPTQSPIERFGDVIFRNLNGSRCSAGSIGCK